MGRNPSIIKETRRQKMHRGIRKRTLASIRDVALHRVKVKARLHTIILSGSKEYRKEYKLELLEKGLGKLWPDKGFKPEDRSGNYKLKFIRQSKYFQINVFMISTNHRPPIQIEIHQKRDVHFKELKNKLIEISKSIPGLKVQSVEYAIDQFCQTPMGVKNLFWVERFSLYVPNQGKEVPPMSENQVAFDRKGKKILVLQTEDETNESRDGELNDEESCDGDVPSLDEFNDSNEKEEGKALIARFGRKNKMYERGNDKDKKDGIWYYNKLKFVRLEHTADRRELFANEIDTLQDLIFNPYFFKINKNIWNFHKFKEGQSKKLIKEWESNATPFQKLLKNTILKNPTQYAEAVEELIPLRKKIIDAMKLFDEEWAGSPMK